MVFCYFCSICCDFLFFISNFVYLGIFSPLLGASGQKSVNFVYLIKEPAFCFIDFFYCFLNLYFTDFFSDLYDFIPSIGFRFPCLSFSNSFRWWINLSILDFSSFLRKACITMNFRLSTAFVASHRLNGCVFIISCLEVVLNFLLESSLTHFF